MKNLNRTLMLALACLSCAAARAEISDNVMRVGVLNDISGIFQDTNGMGSVEAARMAAEDFNGGAPYDYYRLIATIAADQAFRSLADGGCALVK